MITGLWNSKGGQRIKTSDQSESPKSACADTTLQDGGHPYLEGVNMAQRLACKSRFEGCIHLDSNSSCTQKVFTVCIPRANIRIQLPFFGLLSAPWVFTKTLKPVSAILIELGVCMIVYIDNILLLAESRQSLEAHVAELVYLLECLGFIINKEKSLLQPTQLLEFLGVMVDTLAIELKLPREKMKKMCAEAGKLLQEEFISARSLSCLLGKINATSQVIPAAPLFYCHLQMQLTNTLESSLQDYEAQVVLFQDCIEELNW